MAHKTSSAFLARVSLISILLAIAGLANAKRDIPTNPTTDDQMKQPEFLFKHDRGVLIPGLGRILLPPPHLKPHLKPLLHHPYIGRVGGSPGGSVGGSPGGSVGGSPGGSVGGSPGGSIGGSPGGSTGGSTGGRRQVPGGDDTFVPNPGFEVPIPGSGAGAGTPPNP